MRWIVFFFLPFLLAWATTFSLASIFQTQFSINDLVIVGIDVSLQDRISLSIQDWGGLAPTYGVMIGMGYLIVFSIVCLVYVKLKVCQRRLQVLLFSIAGIITISAILVTLQPFLDASLTANVGELSFYTQLLAGLCGGALFGTRHRLQHQPPVN